MTKYKARIPRYVLDKSKGQTCFFGISLGNANQSGEKLEATIQAINDNFDECVIGISDTLQIPNHMAKGMSYKEARKLCIQQRYEWLVENNHILKKLTIPNRIQLWDETMSLPCKYGGLKTRLKQMYASNDSFKNLIDQDVHKFVSRNAFFEGKEEFCREFIFEELDGYSRIGQTGKYVKPYPSKCPKFFKVFLEGQYPEITSGHQNIIFAPVYFDKLALNNNEKAKKEVGSVA